MINSTGRRKVRLEGDASFSIFFRLLLFVRREWDYKRFLTRLQGFLGIRGCLGERVSEGNGREPSERQWLDAAGDTETNVT